MRVAALAFVVTVSIAYAKERTPMIHSAYAVGGRLKSKAQIDKTNFRCFDFIYLMAGPKWDARNFSGSQKAALKSLVTDHAYPKGDKGEALVPAFIKAARNNGVKVFLSLPGHKPFRTVSESPKERKAWAEVMVAFVKKYGYDGIEIDWEGADLRLNLHAALIKDLRTALNDIQTKERRYWLTTALHSYHKIPKDVAKTWCADLDWINIMTYDLGGGVWGRVATHNTPLNVMKEHVARRYVRGGIPKDKICIGLANYGFIYRDLKPGAKSPVKLDKKGKYVSWTQCLDLFSKGWKEVYDDKAKASYYVSPNSKDFVTIDNPNSLNHKLDWIEAGGFRGVFWWELHCDLILARPDGKWNTHDLIDHVSKRLKRIK